ncbi:hypothetical protein ACKVWC_011553 [Pyricularia oryzae]
MKNPKILEGVSVHRATTIATATDQTLALELVLPALLRLALLSVKQVGNAFQVRCLRPPLHRALRRSRHELLSHLAPSRLLTVVSTVGPLEFALLRHTDTLEILEQVEYHSALLPHV